MTVWVVAISLAAFMAVGFVTAFIAIALRRRIERVWISAVLAGLVVPVLLCGLGFLGMLDATPDVDGPAPGNVFAGVLGLAAVMTPFTLIVSALVTRWTGTRARRVES